MRFLKRLLRILLAVVILGIAAAGILYHLSTRLPEGYHPNEMTLEQRNANATRMEQEKWLPLTEYANDAQRRAIRARNGSAGSQPAAPEPMTITFTQDEINAALWKWTDPYKSRYEKYASNPYIRLDTGKIIVMGTVPEFDKVLSLHFTPGIDAQGMLRCDLASVRVGRVPLPEKLFDKQRAKLESSLKAKLPQWQNSAQIDPTGRSNTNAASAAMSRLLLQMLAHQSSPAIIFLPTTGIDYSKPVPVRLTRISATPGELTVTVKPLDAAETQTFLTTLRQTTPPTPGG